MFIVQFFQKNLRVKSDDELFKLSEPLIKTYADDVSSDYHGQLLTFGKTFGREIENINDVFELAQLLFTKHSVLCPTFCEICTALILFLIISVSTASAERTFSKLKLVKHYFRN